MTRQIAVVTGASRGIGRALVEALRQREQVVGAIARSPRDLADVATDTGALPYLLDVADPSDQLVEDIASGMLDGLSGRYLRAGVDAWRALAAQVSEVNEADAHVLRLRTL